MKPTSPKTPEPSSAELLGIRQPRGFPGLPPGWVSEWETIESSGGGIKLFGVTHHKEPWKDGRLLIVLHGMGEHGGRYYHVPSYMRSSVDAVYCIDHRGHGRSEGIRGHVERFDELTEDVAAVVSRLDKKMHDRFGKKAELHLFGHSLGGHLALRMLFLFPDLPLKSVTVSAPFLAIKAKVPVAKKLAAIGLSHLWGSIQMDTGLDVNALSHDPEVIEAYLQDRLVHGKMTPRFYTGLLAAMEDTIKRDSGISQPLQMVVPLQDNIVDPDVSMRFFRNLKHRDKRLKTYPDFFHEPVNEVGKEQVFEDIVSWIESHK